MTAATFALAYAVLFVVFLVVVLALCKASKGREDEWR